MVQKKNGYTNPIKKFTTKLNWYVKEYGWPAFLLSCTISYYLGFVIAGLTTIMIPQGTAKALAFNLFSLTFSAVFIYKIIPEVLEKWFER
ncbi:MAG: hypothetical protein ACFFD1_00930 [Candidatus Thorarchaeota archaeon]